MEQAKIEDPGQQPELVAIGNTSGTGDAVTVNNEKAPSVNTSVSIDSKENPAPDGENKSKKVSSERKSLYDEKYAQIKERRKANEIKSGECFF